MVRKAQAWLWMLSDKVISQNTSAYCQARKRIPVDWLHTIWRELTDRIEKGVTEKHRWLGRDVIVVDGSGITMPDTSENQVVYPQSTRQKPGCGFPIMRLVAAFSLATGAMLDLAGGPLSDHERTLFHRIWDRFQKGSVVLADRGFCSYADFWVLLQRGIDSVMRLNARRTVGVNEVKRLNKNDRIVQWIKTKVYINWMTRDDWLAMPETLMIREVSIAIDIPGFRTERITVVTTLLDSKLYSAEALADLYRRRWLAELFLRDVKISMGMDVLRCKSPEMVHREIWIHAIAYNLIRALMFQAACQKGAPIFRLSITGAIATVRQWEPVMWGIESLEGMKKTIEVILEIVAKDKIPDRPNRVEPRVLKKRKKNYQLMNKPRAEMKEIRHRNKYKKGLS